MRLLDGLGPLISPFPNLAGPAPGKLGNYGITTGWFSTPQVVFQRQPDSSPLQSLPPTLSPCQKDTSSLEGVLVLRSSPALPILFPAQPRLHPNLGLRHQIARLQKVTASSWNRRGAQGPEKESSWTKVMAPWKQHIRILASQR